MVSSDHNINLLKPEQRVRERNKNETNDPLVYFDRWDFYLSGYGYQTNNPPKHRAY